MHNVQRAYDNSASHWDDINGKKQTAQIIHATFFKPSNIFAINKAAAAFERYFVNIYLVLVLVMLSVVSDNLRFS